MAARVHACLNTRANRQTTSHRVLENQITHGFSRHAIVRNVSRRAAHDVTQCDNAMLHALALQGTSRVHIISCPSSLTSRRRRAASPRAVRLRFQEESDPAEYVELLAEQMLPTTRYEDLHILKGPYVMEKWDPELMEARV